MKMDLEGKLALVTGSTKGIGKAIAIELAKEKVNVIINGRNRDQVNDVINELSNNYPDVNFYDGTADILNKDDQAKLLSKFENVDILINNMGIFKPMNYFDIDNDTWMNFFKTNVLTGNELSKFYLPKMLNKNFGRIIFIASEEAIMPSGEMPQYSMTKSMNLSLAKSLSKLTKGTQVTVNTIMPGSTLTEGVSNMLYDMYKDTNLPKEDWEKDFMKNHRPLSQIQRFVRPEEIGRFATFVSSPYASSFSGEALRVDGGMVPTIF
ncbi:SDR family NAD(P)-dependent oxidoreductase [Lactobacillus sp. S2-2]|uniref:SDR family NAD(P)-dependent oxidoreductase n=1 Tax=Lactobacillus sp. S2-2 TaxID=2692917 RepID=UPI001F2D8BA3|nr:SDR family oxidoreductase [Lactobacillus sp. S2-2]MCF6515451.1 SDR family NAD(P)-dependent oxidoreductase [Lactobacillus sp. S2-2]